MSLARAFVGRVRRALERRAGEVLDRLLSPEPARPVTNAARVSPFAERDPAPVVAPTVPPLTPAPSGPVLTFAEVEALLDDMVRPALVSDGGNITLLKVENNDIYVQLVGACSTCSSSVVTMRNGIERLLREEFPQFGELHEVTGGA